MTAAPLRPPGTLHVPEPGEHAHDDGYRRRLVDLLPATGTIRRTGLSLLTAGAPPA